MDINDISKVANRKRINTDAEELRHNLSRETAKIIKLKLAQDTAYWDLKEKLRQVEGNHEKLQQNMVEVQMQHEAISGQYQEELRLRPDTLNKVSSTREICDVLEDYSARLKETLTRCRADHAALGDAYRASGQLVRELRARQREDAEAVRRHAAALEEKVKLLTEHQNQLLQVFSAVKQQAAAESNELRAQLAAARAHEQELATAHAELARTLDLCKHDVEKKEEMYSNLQADMKKMMQEFNKQATEATAIFAEQDKQLKDFKEENLSLKKAVDNQDEFTKSICEQKNALQEKIAALEDENLALLQTNGELKAKFEDASCLNDNLQNNVATLSDEKQNLSMKVQEAQQTIIDLEEEIKNLEAKCTKLENEKSEVLAELGKVVEESNSRAIEVEKLSSLTKEQQIELSSLDAEFKAYRDASEEKNKELNGLIVAKDNELDSKASTITKLMSEVKKLEEALQRIKREIEIERDAVKDKEKRMSTTIGQLETSVRDKDDELSKQMSVILEMRNEKERLQEKIQDMQTAMDNIQKELTRPASQPSARLQPELDDNAVMLTPSHKSTQLQPVTTPLTPAPTQFVVPRAQDPDDMVYHLFSESSNDADCLDSAVVNARFNALARGECLSPMPLAALMRRGAPATHRATKHKHANNNNTQVSLSSQPKTELKSKERSFFKNKRRQ